MSAVLALLRLAPRSELYDDLRPLLRLAEAAPHILPDACTELGTLAAAVQHYPVRVLLTPSASPEPPVPPIAGATVLTPTRPITGPALANLVRTASIALDAGGSFLLLTDGTVHAGDARRRLVTALRTLADPAPWGRR